MGWGIPLERSDARYPLGQPCPPARLRPPFENRRAQDGERAAALAAEKPKRIAAERKATAFAQKIVVIWNSRRAGGRELWFYPTIAAAIAAGVPWLVYSCPACQHGGSLDLRKLDRHPSASISSLIKRFRVQLTTKS